MKRQRGFLVFFAAVLCLTIVGIAFAASSGNHSVTVQVNAINEIGISGGNITLTVNSATAGSDPDAEVDNTTCDLQWTSNESSKKITVVTDNASQSFTLKVVAQSVSGGTAASEVTLCTTTTDFITTIYKTTGTCNLKYTAEGRTSQRVGIDVHTVIYTITDL